MEQEVPSATATFTQVLADYEAFRRNVSPEYAMSQGDDTRAGELADVSPRGHITVLNGTREYLERVVGIDVAALSVADQLDYRLFRRQLEMVVEGDQFGDWMMAISARNGPHQDIPQMGDLDRLQT